MTSTQPTENKKISRRKREKDRQRRDVLAAALDLFSARGYHSVSMQEIAQRAEFAVGTLYNFFENKEGLYEALVLELADTFDQALMKAMENADDDVDKLRNYIRTKGEMFRKDAPMIRLYFGETRGSTFTHFADLDAKIRSRRTRIIRTLASVFENGIQKRRFEAIAPPALLAVALDGMINAVLFHWLESEEAFPALEDPDMMLDILFKGLLPRSP